MGILWFADGQGQEKKGEESENLNRDIHISINFEREILNLWSEIRRIFLYFPEMAHNSTLPSFR